MRYAVMWHVQRCEENVKLKQAVVIYTQQLHGRLNLQPPHADNAESQRTQKDFLFQGLNFHTVALHL